MNNIFLGFEGQTCYELKKQLQAPIEFGCKCITAVGNRYQYFSTGLAANFFNPIQMKLIPFKSGGHFLEHLRSLLHNDSNVRVYFIVVPLLVRLAVVLIGAAGRGWG